MILALYAGHCCNFEQMKDANQSSQSTMETLKNQVEGTEVLVENSLAKIERCRASIALDENLGKRL